jgi:signal transduction histidine kinase
MERRSQEQPEQIVAEPREGVFDAALLADAAEIVVEAAKFAERAPYRAECSDQESVSVAVYGRPPERAYGVRVLNLASSARFESNPLPSAATLAAGRIIVCGVGALPVAIPFGAKTTLTDLARRMHDASLGLKAVVHTSGNRDSLFITAIHRRGEHRGALGFEVEQRGEGATLRLAQVRNTQPARIEVDDVMFVSETNTFDGAIPGAEIRVQRRCDTPVVLTIYRDRSMMAQHLRELVTLLDARGTSPVDDIARIRAELTEVTAQRDRAVATIDACPVGLRVEDVNGQVMLVNPAYLQETGLSLDAALAGQKRPRSNTETLQVEESTFWFDDQPAGRLTTCVDVAPYLASARERDELVTLVTHEFRTPLTSLRGFADLLLARDYPRDKQADFLRIIRGEAARLSDMVNDFLDLQRLSASNHNLETGPVDIAEVIRVAQMSLEAAARDHVLRFDYASDAPLAIAEERAVAQVLTNLVANAVKYSAAGSTIDIRVRAFGDDVALEVTDRGVGIGPENLGKVFDRFYRVAMPGSDQPAGTGLGLAIVDRIAKQLRARVDVESVLGEGSTFRVIFEGVPTVRAA